MPSTRIFLVSAAIMALVFTALITAPLAAGEPSAPGPNEPGGVKPDTPEMKPVKSVEGAFEFPFDIDKDYNGQPDLWARVFDKDNPTRVSSRLEDMKSGLGKSVVFHLNHGGALLETAQYLDVDWRITYSLESWVKPVGLKMSKAWAEVRFFDKDLKPLPEFTVRTAPVEATSDSFIERAAVVENLGKRVRYAKLYCVLSGVFEEFDSKEKPAYAAFNAVIMKEFPRSVISGDAVYYVGDCASVTITTSALKPGKYQTEQEFLDYRLVTDYIKYPMIVDGFDQEGFMPHVFTGTPLTSRPGYFLYRFSIKNEEGRLVSRSSVPYIVLERRAPFQTPEFGASADYTMKPQRLENLLSYEGLGFILITFPLDNAGFPALRKLFDFTLPGVEKTGQIVVPEGATLADDKARAELARAVEGTRQLAREFSDEVSSFILRLPDPSVLSRKASLWALSDMMKPIRQVKTASRIGFAPGAGAETALPEGFDYRVLDVSTEGYGKNLPAVSENVELVNLLLPEYARNKHYEQMIQLSRTIIELKRAGYTKICVDSLSDDRFGLTGSSGEMRPGFMVYRRLAFILTGAKPVTLFDPATSAPFTIHPDAETIFFQTPRGYVMAAWNEGLPMNASAYLGSDAVIYNLLEGSSKPYSKDGKSLIPVSKMPTLVTNVNLDLIRFYLGIKFETEHLACRLKPQTATFSFTNHFSEPVDVSITVEYPEGWTAERNVFSFERVGAGESRNASTTVSIPQQTTIAVKMITFDVNVYKTRTDPRAPKVTLYELRSERPLKMWSEVTAEISWQPKTKALRIRVKNSEKTPIAMDVYSKLVGQPTGLDSVSLPANGTRDIFLPITAKNPIGEVLHLGFREQGGDRFYNLDYTIPSPEGENAGGF